MCVVVVINAYTVLVTKLEEERLTGRPSHKWKENNKMDFKHRVQMWSGVIWSGQGKR
jgi:hypothetical protein